MHNVKELGKRYGIHMYFFSKKEGHLTIHWATSSPSDVGLFTTDVLEEGEGPVKKMFSQDETKSRPSLTPGGRGAPIHIYMVRS